MAAVTWPELPCGCGTVARCADCGTCTDCYGCECPRPDYDLAAEEAEVRRQWEADDAADEADALYKADFGGVPLVPRAGGRPGHGPVSKARARVAARRAAKAGPPPHVGPAPLAMEPTEPVEPA
ncbi:hypothetical protein [Nocardia rhizosphaerae]|uniref:Uncharacterized protein n=1 Tax=Nocardia rhizosphaerae TaxID=1691571 RepID=A0ABV8LB13_9NOCA